MTPSLDAVLFDLDDTLCVYERSVAEVLSLSFERAGVEPYFDAATYREEFDRFVDEFDDVDALREQCFATISERRGRDPALGREIAAEYAALRDTTRVDPRPGARDAVASLAAECPVGLITNGGAAIQRPKLEQVGLVDAFDVVVFAGEDTPAKPAVEPFERALSALDAAPERSVHVGNSLSSDVAGAAAAGLRSVWTPTDPDLPEDVDDPGAVDAAHPGLDPRPDHVLAGLEELPAVLGVGP